MLLPPTVRRPVVPVGVDPLVGQDLDVFSAGSAVQLVGSGQPAAHPVRQTALLSDMVLEIRGSLHRVLSGWERGSVVKWLLVRQTWMSSSKITVKHVLIYQTEIIHEEFRHSPADWTSASSFVSCWRCFHWPSGIIFPLIGCFSFSTSDLSPPRRPPHPLQPSSVHMCFNHYFRLDLTSFQDVWIVANSAHNKMFSLLLQISADVQTMSLAARHLSIWFTSLIVQQIFIRWFFVHSPLCCVCYLCVKAKRCDMEQPVGGRKRRILSISKV